MSPPTVDLPTAPPVYEDDCKGLAPFADHPATLYNRTGWTDVAIEELTCDESRRISDR